MAEQIEYSYLRPEQHYKNILFELTKSELHNCHDGKHQQVHKRRILGEIVFTARKNVASDDDRDECVADLDIDIVARRTRTSLMLRRQSEQHVLRLEIAMNNTVSSKQRQTSHNAVGRSTCRSQWKSAITSSFERLVQVHPERLEHDARVTSKLEMVHHPDYVRLAIRVGTRQQTQHSNFVESLAPETVLAAHNLHRYPATGLVIKRSHYLTETAASEHLEYLIAIIHTQSQHTRWLVVWRSG